MRPYFYNSKEIPTLALGDDNDIMVESVVLRESVRVGLSRQLDLTFHEHPHNSMRDLNSNLSNSTIATPGSRNHHSSSRRINGDISVRMSNSNSQRTYDTSSSKLSSRMRDSNHSLSTSGLTPGSFNAPQFSSLYHPSTDLVNTDKYNRTDDDSTLLNSNKYSANSSLFTSFSPKYSYFSNFTNNGNASNKIETPNTNNTNNNLNRTNSKNNSVRMIQAGVRNSNSNSYRSARSAKTPSLRYNNLGTSIRSARSVGGTPKPRSGLADGECDTCSDRCHVCQM